MKMRVLGQEARLSWKHSLSVGSAMRTKTISRIRRMKREKRRERSKLSSLWLIRSTKRRRRTKKEG